MGRAGDAVAPGDRAETCFPLYAERRCCRFRPALWSADSLAEGDQVSIRREYQQLTLKIRLVDRPVDISLGQSIELRFEFGVEPIDIANVDVVGEVSCAGRSCVFGGFLQEPKVHLLALDVGIVPVTMQYLEPQRVKKARACCMSRTCMNGVIWMKFDKVPALGRKGNTD